MKPTSEHFTQIALLLRERQDKEAAIRELDKRIFALLGMETVTDRKRKRLTTSAMRVLCGL